jgi:hypothetical protein
MDFDVWLIWFTAILIFIIRGKTIARAITQANKERIRRIAEKNNVLLQLQRSNPTRILYLRDFEVDGVRLKPGEFYNNEYTFIDTNFETKLAFKLGWLGYFVAVGRLSGDIGADRYSIDDKSWKDEVSKLMETSSMIILRPSLSPGIIWEFEQVLKNKHSKKTVICYDKNGDGWNNYNLFRDMTNNLIKLPPAIMSTKYMCIDEKNSVHKYWRLQRTPIYKQIFFRQKGNIKQLKSRIKTEIPYKMVQEKERAQTIDILLFATLVVVVILLYMYLKWLD